MVSFAHISVNVRCLGAIQDSIHGVRCAPFFEKIHEISLWCLINELRKTNWIERYARDVKTENWQGKFSENLKYGRENEKNIVKFPSLLTPAAAWSCSGESGVATKLPQNNFRHLQWKHLYEFVMLFTVCSTTVAKPRTNMVNLTWWTHFKFKARRFCAQKFVIFAEITKIVRKRENFIIHIWKLERCTRKSWKLFPFLKTFCSIQFSHCSTFSLLPHLLRLSPTKEKRARAIDEIWYFFVICDFWQQKKIKAPFFLSSSRLEIIVERTKKLHRVQTFTRLIPSTFIPRLTQLRAGNVNENSSKQTCRPWCGLITSNVAYLSILPSTQ